MAEMVTVQDIYGLMDRKAPFYMQEDWDNSGLLVGRRSRPVERVLCTLDITPEVIEEAREKSCELILSHHPVIFQPLKQVTDSDYTARRVLALAESGIAALCCHTCLDSAPGGVNDVLADLCGLTAERVPLEEAGKDACGVPFGIGRVGCLPEPTAFGDYLERLRTALRPNGLRYYQTSDMVSRVAVGGGACGSMLGEAIASGCDTFVTADLKYDHFLEAKDAGLNLIDAGHYPTEQPVMLRAAEWLREAFPELEVLQTSVHREVISYHSGS